MTLQQTYAGEPWIAYVRIAVSNNCCPTCREAQEHTPNPPKLPIEGCSHELGCRCFYEPVLEEIYP